MMKNAYREMISARTPVIFDGAMGTQIQLHDIPQDDFHGHSGCNEILCLTRPDVIVDIHASYLNAGANVIETNSFGGNEIKLGEYDLDDKVYDINKAAALLARKAVSLAKNDRPCFVCGTMGPTGILLSSSSAGGEKPTFDEIALLFGRQAAALVDGGADILLLETMQDLLEVRAAIVGIRRMLDERALHVPLQVQITLDANGHMLLGSNVDAFCGAVANLHCDVIGFNCSTGPAEMTPWAEELLSKSNKPVSMLPNAGMPKNVDGKAVYDMDPKSFAQAVEKLVVDKGVSVVGGCCGTTPEHIKALAIQLADKKAALRSTMPRTFVATGLGGTDLELLKKPIIIGERLNAQGSKKTKELVLAKDFDELYQVALEQIDKGSGLLDLCVATTENDDEHKTMASLVSFLSERISVPFCIDSTEPAVFEAALRACPGSALVNSINLEHAGEKARIILSMAKEFGCPVVALTIDDNGMAKTVPQKLDISKRIIDLACGEFGLPQQFVYIDPLTFTLATGDPESADAAKNSLEALFRLKEAFPSVRTVMGVSNVSFGLKPASRRILNNVMLHYAVQAGLDASIFNPLHIDKIDSYDPSVRVLAEDLLFNRKPDALAAYISFFDNVKIAPLSEMSQQAVDQAKSPEERLHDKILNRDRRNLSQLIDLLLATRKPHDILNEILLPAMALVGDKMNAGEMILPFVLQAAEVMKEAISILEPHLKGAEATLRGTIVLATVYGDVHDIGKNLVASILKNQGYNVIDCGKQVPAEEIIKIVTQEKPDAIGLSALLVATSREMCHVVAELDREKLNVPVLIGGAAVNRDFASRVARLDNGDTYKAGVYYAKDAFEAIRVLDAIKHHTAVPEITQVKPAVQKTTLTSDVMPIELTHPEIVLPHLFGTSKVLRWDTAEILDRIDTARLYKGFFSGGRLDEKAFAITVEKDFAPAYEELKNEILSKNLLDASALYGIFPVFTDDNKICVLDPSDHSKVVADFVMPRVARRQNRSIADYFRPEGDVIAIQIVTIGKAIDDRCTRYFNEDGKYSYGFYLNGIANYITEILADRVTTEIRRAFLITANRGRRYSFGFPGLPGTEEQSKLFEVLGVEERLNVTLTNGGEIVPEHSTMAIFVHHPEADYL